MSFSAKVRTKVKRALSSTAIWRVSPAHIWARGWFGCRRDMDVWSSGLTHTFSPQLWAALCPLQCRMLPFTRVGGKVNLFLFFCFQGALVITVLVDIGEYDLCCGHKQQTQHQCPCVWEVRYHVYVEEVSEAPAVLTHFCKAQETWGASLWSWEEEILPYCKQMNVRVDKSASSSDSPAFPQVKDRVSIWRWMFPNAQSLVT